MRAARGIVDVFLGWLRAIAIYISPMHTLPSTNTTEGEGGSSAISPSSSNSRPEKIAKYRIKCQSNMKRIAHAFKIGRM